VFNLSIAPGLSRKIRFNLLVALLFLSVGASSPLASLEREVSDPASLEEVVEIASAPEFELPRVPSRKHSPPLTTAKSLAHGEDLIAQASKGPDGRYYLERDGALRTLTLDGALQDKLTRTLKEYRTPYAAVVVLETSTGKVLAMAEHSERDPKMRGLTTKAIFPAASIFKIVTASALLDSGIKPEDTECFHGGKRRISERLLVDSRRDQTCYTLTTALAKSANVVFAKLTQKHLTPEKLKARALEFLFNRPIAFPIPTDLSLASIPEDPLGFASAGSGFGDVYLSPLHAAGIAAIAAA
jgi:membrane peptidoglycan carboxypeptidase